MKEGIPDTAGSLFGRPAWLVLPAAASLLLSAGILLLEPVVNDASAVTLHAARLFAEGHWRAGLDASEHPIFALITALASNLTGVRVLYAAQALNAVFHALLVVGFIAAATAAGSGSSRVRVIALLLVVSFPALNGFRSDVAGESAYWALYIWSLAGWMYSVAGGGGRAFRIWLFAGGAALLFGLEMIMFLVIVPAWQWGRLGGRGRRLMVLLAALFLAVLYAAWREAWLGGTPVELVRDPLAGFAGGWHELLRGIQFGLKGLRNEFLDEYSRDYDGVALVMSVWVLSLVALLKTLGPVHAAAAAGAAAGARGVRASARDAWGVFSLLSLLLLLVPALVSFEVTARDATTAALTLLVMAPAALERLHATAAPAVRRWGPLLAGTLLLATAIAGLNPASGDNYQRRAGLWLADHAPAGASVFSNSRTLVWYSGLDGFRPGGSYTWQEGMAAVWQKRWREYDYLALVIDAADAHREGILTRRISARPLKRFTSNAGDRVLIFKSGE